MRTGRYQPTGSTIYNESTHVVKPVHYNYTIYKGSKRCFRKFTWIVANTPQGPPSCCTKPIDVSVSGLNLHQNNHFLAIIITITTPNIYIY